MVLWKNKSEGDKYLGMYLSTKMSFNVIWSELCMKGKKGMCALIADTVQRERKNIVNSGTREGCLINFFCLIHSTERRSALED